jgi:PKD repeat protein
MQIVGGSGSCSLALSTPGERTLTATYEGNASFAGSSAQETHTVSTPNQAPEAAFEFDCDALECDFRSRSSDSDGRIVNYAWAFGDGETSGDGDDEGPEHIYDTPGIYQVTLTVTDEDGATGSITQPVDLSQTAENQAPVASIGAISCTGMTCSFTDASTDPDGNDTIAEWSWIFGDGGSSSERNPIHAYSAPDQYDVELRVVDNRGLSSTDSEAVTVAVEDGASGGG